MTEIATIFIFPESSTPIPHESLNSASKSKFNLLPFKMSYTGEDNEGGMKEIPSSDKSEDLPPWTRKQLITLISMCSVNVFSAMYYSLLAPFFTQEVNCYFIMVQSPIGL